MSEENLEVIRRLYEAMNARDFEAATELADPSAEWIPDERVGDGPARGRQAVVGFFRERAEMFSDVRTEVERLRDREDQVLAFIRVTGSGASSGAGFDISVAHLWTLRDGVVVCGEGYGDRDEALRAAGLEE